MLKDLQSVKHIIINPLIKPDTQRDAVNIRTQIPEGHNHCKNTSCTMALNWVGQHYAGSPGVNSNVATLSNMGEYQYNSILLIPGFMQADEKIQSWQPQIKAINQMLVNGNVPLNAHYVKFRQNYDRIIYSLLSGRPVVLGTWITQDGHIVLLVGMTQNGDFIIIDPYGDPLSGYKIKTADYYIIPSAQFTQWVREDCSCIYFSERT